MKRNIKTMIDITIFLRIYALQQTPRITQTTMATIIAPTRNIKARIILAKAGFIVTFYSLKKQSTDNMMPEP